MTHLRLAIVGAGLMGRWHARYARRAGGRVAAVVDTWPEAADRLASRFRGARIFPDLGACLGACPLDVVHVCTPSAGHAALVEMALGAGKPVLVEKPAARSLAETQRLVAAARAHGVQLSAVHQFPFQRGWRQLERWRHRLGELVRVTFHISSAGGTDRRAAERRAIVWEMLPHPLTLLRRLLGVSLAEVPWDYGFRTDDELELLGGVRGTRIGICLSLRGRPTRNEMTVLGSEGTVHLDFYHGYGVFESGTVSRTAKVVRPLRQGLALLSGAAWNLAWRTWRGEPAYPGLAELIRLFYQSVRDGGPAPVSPDELLEVAQVMEQVDVLCVGTGDSVPPREAA